MVNRVILTCTASVLFGLMICLAPIKNSSEVATEPVMSVYETTTEAREEKAEYYESLGTFELTAYCSCSKCSGPWGRNTSTGKTAKAGRTIAVDPRVIPYGSTILIDDHAYIAEDCGGAIKGNSIDIFFDSHGDALEFGRQYEEVFIKRGELK